jgi:hypothetical protein
MVVLFSAAMTDKGTTLKFEAICTAKGWIQNWLALEIFRSSLA